MTIEQFDPSTTTTCSRIFYQIVLDFSSLSFKKSFHSSGKINVIGASIRYKNPSKFPNTSRKIILPSKYLRTWKVINFLKLI